LLVKDGFIFAGTEGNAVWKRSLTDITGISQLSSETPAEYNLKQNYPNPFNPVTNISYEVLKSGNVKISVFDISGKKLTDIVNQFHSTGSYNVTFDGTDFPSGSYFYRMESADFSVVKKMILLK